MERMTNLEYIENFCTIKEMAVIVMLAESYIDKTVGNDATLSVKEEALDKWFNSVLDLDAWAQAKAIDKEREEHKYKR